jgi:hypothetical protein
VKMRATMFTIKETYYNSEEPAQLWHVLQRPLVDRDNCRTSHFTGARL